jgi:hypothetical protein
MSLLVIHGPTTDPTPFIRSLSGSQGVWKIDNKYYTARVDVVLKPVNELEEGVEAEAVVYLYDDVRSFPFLAWYTLMPRRTRHPRSNSPHSSPPPHQNSRSPSDCPRPVLPP